MNMNILNEPLRFGIEMLLSTIVLGLFLFIFFRTRELYTISKHKGIKYFRTSFLFFSLGYLSRIVFYIFRFFFSQNAGIPGRIFSDISLLSIGLFGTIAISYLIYSNFWKKLDYRIFLFLSISLSIGIVILSWLFFSVYFILLIQILLISLILLIDKNKPIAILYVLISLFWMINMIAFYSRNMLSFEIKIILQSFSILILLFMTYRVSKWIR